MAWLRVVQFVLELIHALSDIELRQMVRYFFMDKNQARFRERLERMEQAGAAQQKQKDEALRAVRQQAAMASRKRMQAMMVLILGILIVGGAVFYSLKGLDKGEGQAASGSVFAQAEPPKSEGSGLVSMVELAREDVEAQPIEASRAGNIFRALVVLAEGADEVGLRAVASGFEPPDAQTSLGALTMLDQNEGCTLRPPASSEKVVGVRVESFVSTAPFYAIFDQNLIATVQKALTEATQEPQDFGGFEPVEGSFGLTTVWLTDTSAPLYVVLQTPERNMMWNLQLAQGVSVAHVVMISRNISAVVGVPEAAGVEIIRVDDYMPDRGYSDMAAMGECMVFPWRAPQERWLAVQQNNFGAREMVALYAEGHAAYAAWYARAFGVSADANTLAAMAAAHVLLGPRPAMPLSYVPLEGRAVRMTRVENAYHGREATRQADILRRHDTLLRTVIGGDVGLLWPATVERSQP